MILTSAFAVVFGLIVVAIILDGFTLYILWGWFVVPLFGLPMLTISQAIGVSLTVGFVAHQYYATPDGKGVDRFSFMFVNPAITLAVAWVVKQWAVP